MEHALSLFGIDPDQIVFGNPVGDWIFALGIGLATFAVLLVARRHLTRQVDRYAGAHLPQGVRLLVMLVAQTRVFLLLALSLIVGSKYLDLGERAAKLTTAVIVTMVALQIGLWMSASVRFYLEEQSAASSDRNSRTMVTIVQFVADLGIWSLVALLVLDNLGFEVKALLTGLGIGGIAVALAVQNVLGDLLASLSIALDKPFEVGDALTLDNGYQGTVEAIGIKSTRIRSVTGEQIVMSNAELVKTRIRNFGRLRERRAVFRFGIVYGTKPADLKVIPEVVRAAVEAEPGTRFERAHFATFGASALEFEAAYVVLMPDYARYMDTQQSVNLALCTELERRNIRFASTTPTVVIARDAAAS
jgi:small-conductance mechanosensitive channel